MLASDSMWHYGPWIFDAQDIWRPRHLTPKTFDAQDIWCPRHLTPKTFDAQDIWHPRHLTPKTFDTQDIWRPRYLTPKTFKAIDIWLPRHSILYYTVCIGFPHVTTCRHQYTVHNGWQNSHGHKRQILLDESSPKVSRRIKVFALGAEMFGATKLLGIQIWWYQPFLLT